MSSGMILKDCNQATKELSVEQMMTLIRNAPPGPWPKDRQIGDDGKWRDVPDKCWHCWQNTQEAMRQLAIEHAQTGLRPKPDTLKGRGIVIAGGGRRYFPSTYLSVRKIRHLGCKLPIQVWYLGSNEMDPHMMRVLADFGDVECIDAREVAKTIPARILCGWELKLYATAFSSFEEVLFLDADNAPVIDPTFIFDEPLYQEYGCIFWPDYDCWILDEGVFRVFGIPPRRETAFESGQYLIHKGRCWQELMMSWWYAEYSDFTFGHVYGDKECFHLGWRKLGKDYGIIPHPPGWECGHTIVQFSPDRRILFLHRCQDKWRLDGANRPCNHLPDEKLHFAMVKDLAKVWKGNLWENCTPSEKESNEVRKLWYTRWTYKRLPQKDFKGDSREIEFLPGGRIGEGCAECEQRWEMFLDDMGQPTLAICRADRATCCLKQSPDGIWRGRWLEYEQCQIELSRIDTDIIEMRRRDRETLRIEVNSLLVRYGIRPLEEQDFKWIIVSHEQGELQNTNEYPLRHGILPEKVNGKQLESAVV